jgi:glutamate synthase domain-containing protein 1
MIRKRAEADVTLDPETKFVKGNDQFMIEEVNEFLDKKLSAVKQTLMKKNVKERKIWHKELIQVWKNEIPEKDDTLIVPRTAFAFRKKLKRGLENHLNSLTQAFRIAEDHAETEKKFEVKFEYAQYQMRKHINDTISESTKIQN